MQVREPPPFAAALHQFVLCGARRPTCPTARRSSRQEVGQCAAVVVETLHANLHRRRAAARTVRLLQEPETSPPAPLCISLLLLEFHR
ncbi:hypothetical protein GGP41_010384 [Bipolaris sorokiniana]|uniref:Uncharacterized protein n=1 Tax=Cochliobolus sativus TaxID=45130 RepID=A0A8H5ZMB8_COCSA|nr:hypothetical protein GGP41_010384 [Bipolaris sorokiniana]